MAETSSGAFLANDCLVHFTVSALPFGGVGESLRVPTSLSGLSLCWLLSRSLTLLR